MRARAVLWFGVLLLPLVLGGALTTPALAGEDEHERELRAVKAQIERLLEEARKLNADGHTEAAQDVKRRALELRRRLAEYAELRAREHAEHAEKHAASEEKRRKAILRGLAQGIEALQALGRHEEAAHLREIHADVKRGGAAHSEKRAARSERQIVEGWIELLGYAVKVLVEADHHDRAEVLERGKHALELGLAGKKDERSMKIRKGAPSRAQMAECLLHTAELLHDRGDKRHAKLMADLGRQWQQQQRPKAKQREGHEREQEHEQAGLDSLAHRVEIMLLGLKALEEGERKKAAEILERGIRTGKMLLAERDDAEAREIVEQTPPLAHLAEVLHLASDLWTEFGHERQARIVGRLAHYYAERARAQHEEHAAHEDEDHGEQHRRAEELSRLQDQVKEMRAALERMQRQLERLLRDK